MYFRNYRLRNRGLEKCLKNHASEKPSTSNMVNGTNTVGIWTTVPLSYLLITLNIIQSEKVYLSSMENLRTVC